MHDATEALLERLRHSPTDLAKLVKRINQRHREVTAISSQALARWQKEEGDAWERVREWLIKRGVRIVIH